MAVQKRKKSKSERDHRRAQPVHHAPEVDAQHPVPVIERELPDPGPLDHASVVAQYVNRAVGIESGRGQAVDGIDVRDRLTDAHPGLREELAEDGRGVLGGFNWPSQHRVD